MKSSKISIILLIALLTTLLSAAVVHGQDQTMYVEWWGSQNRHDRTIKVIEDYEAAHPGLDITYEFANFNDYWTKLNTQAAGSQLPCVMQQDYAYLAEWSKRDLLAPLDPFFDSKAIDVSDVAQSVLDSGTVDGKVYGLSLGTNSQSFILDTDAFAKAGVDLPAADWTWKDFEDIAMKLHEKLGTWAMAYGLEDVQMWKSLEISAGANAFTVDGSALGYTDDQPITDYYNMIVRLEDAGAIGTPDETAEFANGSPENSPIVTGKEAMRYQWSNQIVAIFNAAGDTRHFKLWPLPRLEGGEPENYLKPSMFFSITANCPTPDLAADFINNFTNSPEANDILNAERGVPISGAVRAHLQPNLDAVGQATFDFLEQVQEDSSPVPPPDPKGYSDVLNNVYAPLFVQPVMYKQISVEDGVATLRKEAEAILAANNPTS
ncbi:MAG: extracellular solute-binding protein [Chloroflexota bacterium]